MDIIKTTAEPILDEQTALVMYLRFTEKFEYDDIAQEVGIQAEQAQKIALTGLRTVKELIYGK